MASISVQLQLPGLSAAMLPTDRAVPEHPPLPSQVDLRLVRRGVSRRCRSSRGSPEEAAVVGDGGGLRCRGGGNRCGQGRQQLQHLCLLRIDRCDLCLERCNAVFVGGGLITDRPNEQGHKVVREALHFLQAVSWYEGGDPS